MKDGLAFILGLSTQQANKDLDTLKNKTQEAGDEMDKTKGKAKSLGQEIQNAFKSTPIISWIATLKKSIDVMIKATSAESEYIESMNLLQVAYGGTAESGEKLINTMNQMLGLNPSGLTKQLGIYRQFSSAMGITNESATMLSENLLKLQADVSSLYNLDFDVAGKKLQSAIAGQTRPIRELGADITEASLQQELYNRGINKSVDSLNRASKSVLIYLTLERQLKNANNDAGATVNQLAQQMRIFKEQTAMAGRQIGAVFIPILKSILPYANAILMIFNDIMGVLLKLLGVDVSKMAKEGLGNRTFGNLSDTFGGLSDNIDKTTKSAKAAKLSLRGFDKLNNITTPTAGSGGVGGIGGIGGSLGGVDSDILKALSEYDLGDISNKAAKIRDSVMSWLGFAKDTNDEWKFSKVTLGTVVAAIIGGGGVLWAVSKVFKVLGGIKTIGGGVLSLLGLGKATSTMKEASNFSKATKSFQLPSFSTVLKGLGELALIVTAIGAFVIAVGELTRIPGFNNVLTKGLKALEETFLGLIKVFPSIALYSVLVLGLGVTSSMVAPGVASLVGIIGGIELLIMAIGLLASIPNMDWVIKNGIQTVKDTFERLSEVILPIAGFSLLVVGLGVASAVVGPGIIAFAAIVLATETLMSALGLLAALPYVTEFVRGGGELMVIMANYLGKFAGALVNGFLNLATEGLGQIGKNLSDFITNSLGFFSNLGVINKETMQGVKYLAETILLLTASNIINGLASWFGMGLDLKAFGDSLNDFTPGLKKFATSMKGVDTDTIQKAGIAAKTIAEFVDAMPRNADGNKSIWSLIAGSKDIKKIGENLPVLGTGLKQYSINIDGMKTKVVENTKSAVKTIFELVDELPSGATGVSVWSLIAGSKDIGVFGTRLPVFGKGIKEYSQQMSGVDPSVVTKTSAAVKTIMEFANNVPNSGGMKAWFSGDNTLDTFGKELAIFGNQFRIYYLNVREIDPTTILQMASAISNMLVIARNIKNAGVQGYLSDFVKEISSSTTGLSKVFSTKHGEELGTQFGKAVAKKIASAIKNYSFPSIKISSPGLGGSTLATYKMSAYKEGGFVNSGEIFMANENGVPEMVGKFGSRTAVASNDQIVEGITIGVARAMERANREVNVNIKADGDTSGLLNFINFKQEQRNRQYGL